jgi:hypothetical protein
MGADTFHWRSKFKPLIEKQAQLEKKKEKQESYPLIVPNVDIEPQVNYHNLGTNLRAVTHARRGDIVQVVGSSGLVMNMTAEEDILMGDQLELFETSPLTVHVKRIQLDFSHLEAATIRNIRFGYGYHDMSNTRVGGVPLHSSSTIYDLTHPIPDSHPVFDMSHYSPGDPAMSRGVAEVAFDFAPYSLSDDLDHHQYWITQHELGHPPSTLQQAMWIREYLQPKYIKWNMMKVLDHKCWTCQHFTDKIITRAYGGDKLSFICQLSNQVEYDKDNLTFPIYVHWIHIQKDQAVESKEQYFFYNYVGTNFLLDECPCFSESQEYHDWKEQQPILKIKDTMISL